MLLIEQQETWGEKEDSALATARIGLRPRPGTSQQRSRSAVYPATEIVIEAVGVHGSPSFLI